MKGKVILITGGTGSWGEALVEQLIKEEVEEIRVFARNEAVQFELANKITARKIKFIVGDIRDRKSLLEACKGVNIVFHLAALKHVPICEMQPLEAIKTNVLGTQNVIDIAKLCRVEKVIYLSTDKAADPSSTYGLTKALGERLILQANSQACHTKFICLRSGNVLSTSGSVIPVFKKQLEREGIVKLTDKRMTRFFVPIQRAIEILIKVVKVGNGGEIFVMKMPAFKIYDIARVMLDAYKKDVTSLIEIGPRPGEKLSEVLITDTEKENAYDIDEDFYMITQEESNVIRKKAKQKGRQVARYSSATSLINRGEIKRILEENGFLPKYDKEEEV